MDKQVILIGGAPTVGKTFLARKLAEKLDLPWISTDTVREMIRKIVSIQDFPDLFKEKDYIAEEYLNKFSAQEIVDNQNRESWDVWKGVRALIETDYSWNSFIVEGVAVLPQLVSQDFSGELVKPIFLVDEDADRIRDTVFKRGLWDDANTYSDDVKEKEVEWAKFFSSWLKGEAEKYDFPWIEIKKDALDLEMVIEKLSLTYEV